MRLSHVQGEMSLTEIRELRRKGTFETEDGGGFSAMPAGVDLNSYSKLVKLEKEKQIMETEQIEAVY